MSAILAFLSALAPFLSALLQALVVGAAKPTTATVQAATPEDAAASARASQTFTSFPGIKLGALVLACLLMQGCFGARVIMPAPAVPVRLAEDVHGVQVFVKAPDGTWQEATADLYAGEVITYDPDFWTLRRTADGQGFVFTASTPNPPAPGEARP